MSERSYGEEEPSEDFAGEETNPAQGTPAIGDEGQVPGQTQTPAADDDVGVPPDEEMNRET
jgi:hypothetical protein